MNAIGWGKRPLVRENERPAKGRPVSVGGVEGLRTAAWFQEGPGKAGTACKLELAGDREGYLGRCERG